MGSLNEGSVLLSGVNINTDLAMGAHNITLGAGQTVDGEDVSGILSNVKHAVLYFGDDDLIRTGDGSWGVQYTFKVNVGKAGAKCRLMAQIRNETGGGSGITSLAVFDGANIIGTAITHDQNTFLWVTGAWETHNDSGDKEYTIKMSSNGTTNARLKGAVVEFMD